MQQPFPGNRNALKAKTLFITGASRRIDILVDNASAISMTDTEHTPMKRHDLMNGNNARGTYLCTQACLLELK